MYRILYTFLLPLIVLSLNAQIQYPGRPVALNYPGSKPIPVIKIQAEKLKDFMLSDSGRHSRLKKDRFAYTVTVEYNYENSGIWDTLDDGLKLWRLGLYADNASSVNIIFSEFNIAKGVRIFIYDNRQKNILGALTYRNNKTGGILATSPVYGDTVYVEMQIPPFTNYPGKFTMGHIGIEYDRRGDGSRLKDQWFGTSGSCNQDINCIDNTLIQKTKHSVCRIIYAGNERCTGTLINNAVSNGRPLVLTAQHCLSTQYLAERAVFYFEYESPYCSGPDGNSLKTVSGSVLLATTDNKLDFSLVELSVTPPFNYKPFYAGWSNLNIPPANSYTIHHPQGDVKKISFDDDKATTDNFGEGYDYNTHWLISNWESGTTEKGSSGCPLFDQNNRIVGSLSGGDANCVSSVNDYYQKLFNAWDDYPEKDHQLKFWLDPQNTGVQYIDGFDPYESIWQSGDTISNITDNSNLTVDRTSLDWGCLSGHNSDSIRFFAERFNIEGQKKLFGTFLNVALLYYTSDKAKITINVWNGDDQPEISLLQKEVLMIDLLENELDFIEFDSVIRVTNNFFVGYQLEYNNPLDSFAVFMTLDNEGYRSNTAFVLHDDAWFPASDFTAGDIPASFDIRPLIFDTIGTSIDYDTTLMPGDIKITPVMATDMVKIEFYEWPDAQAIINIFSLNGQLIASKLYKYPDRLIEYNIAGLRNGIYLVQILYKYHAVSAKLPVIR